MKTDFYKALLASFLIFSAIALPLINKWFDKTYPEAQLPDYGAMDKAPKKFPKDWFNLSIQNAKEAKERNLFWINTWDGKGIAIDVLSHPKLYSDLFPGYEKARTDTEIWKNYFSRKFRSQSWSSVLNSRKEILGTTFYAWTGCFDLFKKYGADVVLVGNSETHSGFSAGLFDRLNRKSAKPLRKLKKILVCSEPFSSMGDIAYTAEKLRKTKKRTKVILYGYSFWNAFIDSWELRPGARPSDQHKDRTKEVQWHQQKLAGFFPNVKWNNIFPANIPWVKNFRLEGFLAPIEHRNNHRELEKITKQTIPYFGPMNGINSGDCDMSRARKQLRNTISKLLKVTDKVVLYLQPGTPFIVENAPQCFMPSVRKMIRTFSSKRVIIETRYWEHYKLNYTDFVFNSRRSDQVFVDLNHANYFGAYKITKKLLGILQTKTNDLF